MAGQSSDIYMMQRQNVLNMPISMMDPHNNQTYNNQQQQSSLSPSSIKCSRRETTDDNTEDSMSQSSDQSHQNANSNKNRKKASSKDTDDDERRKNFLERNRQAALKCRQRKKQWLNNLQAKVEYLTNDNEQLQVQANALREEIINLKTLLVAHKDCAVAQQNGGLNILQRPPGAGMNPANPVMAGPMGMPMPGAVPNPMPSVSSGPNAMRF